MSVDKKPPQGAADLARSDLATVTITGASVEEYVEQREVLLTLLSGEKRIVVELPEGTSRVVGRAAEAEIPIGSVGVSRQHARFEHIHGDVWVTDLGSRNGTRMNGKRIDRAK